MTEGRQPGSENPERDAGLTARDGSANMATAKERIVEIIQQQPDDSSYEEILRELAFARMIDSGLEDSRTGRTISNEEMERRIRTWQR
jgi:predicted transcriptional regulator